MKAASKILAFLLVLVLVLSFTACGGGEKKPMPIETPATTDAHKSGIEREPGSAFEWESPSDVGSTLLELPEFPGVVFSNEYRDGGFGWDCYVRATSKGDEKRLFDFILGPNSVFIDDVTGDGCPDFAFMVSWTSGLYTLGVRVYDYKNDTLHSLEGYGNGYGFGDGYESNANGLIIENGRLMVARCNAEGNLAPVGELVMADGELAIDGVEKQDEPASSKEN